jgi:tripartite-type tricarboxylate transporter receptor subunit TctC
MEPTWRRVVVARLSRIAADVLIGLMILLAGARAASAQGEGANFFRGKTLRIIVGYEAGGGYDVYARLLADHLPKFLPGNPAAVVQYMPGAATEVAANYIAGVAPQDGTVIGIPVASLPIASFIQHNAGEGVNVKALNWIGRLDIIDAVTVVWHAANVDTMVEAQKRQLVFAATSPTGSSFMVPQALTKLGKMNVKLVMGYKGTADAYLAMERGETDGMTNAIWSQIKRNKKDWLAGNKIRILYQQPENRAADLPDVPTLVDLASNEDERRVFHLLASEASFGRSFYVGPNVSAERVRTLRQAFTATANDPSFRDAAATLQTPIDPITGEALQTEIEELATYPASVYELARKLTAP